ncbi:MAG TPA: hypothetical protein VMZ50_05065 [Phycisphaerae bacterium]|nr:hypothetical protein [Phycisphaerae bacterium]
MSRTRERFGIGTHAVRFRNGFEALGEMGALLRVRRKEGRIERHEPIALSYDTKYGSRSYYMMREIYSARLRSVTVSAKQEGIDLPPAWLAEFRKSEIAAIQAAGDSGPEDARKHANSALKAIADEHRRD